MTSRLSANALPSVKLIIAPLLPLAALDVIHLRHRPLRSRWLVLMAARFHAFLGGVFEAERCRFSAMWSDDTFRA